MVDKVLAEIVESALKEFDLKGWKRIISRLKRNLQELRIPEEQTVGVLVDISKDIVQRETGLQLLYDDPKAYPALDAIEQYVYNLK